jgi:ATP-binding cassette subfamily C protein LapB
VRGALELRGVCFGYEAGQPLLDQISLTVQPGEMVAIEGDTGSGKSTLLMLIQRLLLPGGGEVLLDGASLDGVEPAWLRAQVALLPQRGAIYAGTVLENLTSFRAGEVVNQALTLAYLLGVDEAVKRMPQGFDSRIGVGEVLPAGLRQRIAIIRELVKQPAVILFDDADHALDAASRERLLALLRQLAQRAVVVVVSDNPALLQAACRRYRLAQGQLFPLEPHSGKVTVQEVTR